MEKRNGKLMTRDECIAFDLGMAWARELYEGKKYEIGPLTFTNVFSPSGMTNLSNMDQFLQEVERAFENLSAKADVKRYDFDSGILFAASAIKKRLQEYIKDHGNYDHETGQTEFNEAGQEYVTELEEQYEMICGLRSKEPPLRPISKNRFQENFRENATPFWRNLYDRLREHTLSNMMTEDRLGFYPLVDALSREKADITDGEEEIASIVDIAQEVVGKALPVGFVWINEPVTVVGGDYDYRGQLLFSFPKSAAPEAAIRYVVRDKNNRLFIHNAKQCGFEPEVKEPLREDFTKVLNHASELVLNLDEGWVMSADLPEGMASRLVDLAQAVQDLNDEAERMFQPNPDDLDMELYPIGHPKNPR